MCFSATASFTTALVLMPVGVYCVNKATSLQKAYWLFALMPMMFGVQQFFEGVVWLGMESNDAGTTPIAARGYLFFSHLLWLFWIPLSCYAVEDNATKRQFYLYLIILGGAYGLLMYIPLLFHEDWVTVKLAGHSIKYKLILLHEGYVPLKVRNLIYGIFTILPLLLASDRYIKVFGAMIVLSLAITSLYFDHAFLSVWCFFAAVLSLYILIMIMQKTKITES